MAQPTIKDILGQSLERNRYFYGKLMTVRDFTQEQEYFTAKRLVINRLLFGSGVMCGLQVEKAGPEPTTTIVIKPGLALDPLGREVTLLDVPGGNKFDLKNVIPAPLPSFTGEKKGFICLSYRECPKEPVPSLKSSPCDETCESNRLAETFDVSWDEDTSTTPSPSLCEKWLNRTTVAAQDGNFRIERTAPVWVRASEVFEVSVRVTAEQDATNVQITETRTGGSLIEPAPPLSATGQFPTPPVNLKAGEFFVYVYQVKAPAATGDFELRRSPGALPALTSSVKVLSEADAKLRESELTIESNCGEPTESCVRIAELTVHFTASKPDGITDIRNLESPRFRYSLERVTEILDCLRASLLAEAGSPRPGHAFITFNDLETGDPKPVGETPAPGTAFTVTRGDHVHKLRRAANSGLEFLGAGNNELRINGDIGGQAIKFLSTVKGQKPIEAEDLVTKDYVDAHIAGLDWQESVLDKDLTAPPATPKEGDRYLLFNEPSSPWKGPKNEKGHKNDIVTFNGKVWELTTPDEGTATFVEDENIAYLFVDGSWIPFLAAPEVTAGDGLLANGAVLAVGKGKGILVNPNDVEIAYETNLPQPVGPVGSASAGSSDASTRGDHRHELPLSKKGGLEFAADGRLSINGAIAGATITFLNVVSGQTPTQDQHVATKAYVDGKVVASPKVAPGAGLIFDPAGALAVGEGQGIIVGEDIVSVRFSNVVPQPIGPAGSGSAGSSDTPANNAHRHELLLSKKGGLEFAADGRLSINGAIAGATITFLNVVSGQTPTQDQHVATKAYVDGKVVAPPKVVAGKGLTLDAVGALAVGESPGSGIIVTEDLVSVNFSAAVPLQASENGSPGGAVALSRGDHVHPQPKATPGSASGIVAFTLRSDVLLTVQSGPIDPGLGQGPISVQLAYVTPPDTFVFGSGAGFQGATIPIPIVQLATVVKSPPGSAGATFQIIVSSLQSQKPLPLAFLVRWFAYKPSVEGNKVDVVISPNTPPNQ